MKKESRNIKTKMDDPGPQFKPLAQNNDKPERVNQTKSEEDIPPASQSGPVP